MRCPRSQHTVGLPFWIGCLVTPFLGAWISGPKDDASTFIWLIFTCVFAGVIGMFTQALADLFRAQRAGKLHKLEYCFLTLIAFLAVAYGVALFYLPAAETPLRYSLACAAPLMIAQLYTRFEISRRRKLQPK